MGLLRSHPLIETYGEILRNGRTPVRIEGKKVGATIHYTQWKRQPNTIDFKKTKVVHLLRDPYRVALSAVRNRMDAQLRGDRHRANFRVGQELPEVYEVDPRAVEKRRIGIARYQEEFRQMLREKTVFTLAYEELTRDQSIKNAPEVIARPLLDFLGVEYQPLVTNLVKSRTGLGSRRA